ncbi:MAG: V-type ATP synthase subunit F [Thermoplasmata archaeon]|nr:V-type ATP synthase subunit F [Thermoplasmata archaeon]
MKIACIGDRETVAIMKLAGASYCEIADNIEKQFDEMVAREDVGILVINERIAEKIKSRIYNHRLLNDTPVIVEIPDKMGKSGEDGIRKLIMRAVGVDVK